MQKEKLEALKRGDQMAKEEQHFDDSDVPEIEDKQLEEMIMNESWIALVLIFLFFNLSNKLIMPIDLIEVFQEIFHHIFTHTLT